VHDSGAPATPFRWCCVVASDAWVAIEECMDRASERSGALAVDDPELVNTALEAGTHVLGNQSAQLSWVESV